MMKFYKYLVLIIFLGFFSTTRCLAQSDETYYKKAFNKGFTLRPYFCYNVFGMQIETYDDTTSFATNNPLGIGIGISHPRLPIGISVGYGIKATLNRKQLRTKSIDIQAHTYGRKFVIDAFFLKYKGFYIEDFKIKTKNEDRNDLSVLYTGLVGQYVFNHKRFSYIAAYTQKDVQLKSAGTFLAGFGIYFFNVKSPNFYIYDEQNQVKNVQFGLNGGYSYNWVMKNWLLNGSLSAGGNIGNGNIQTKAGYKSFFLKPTALARISIFHNTERWSLGVTGVYNLGMPIYTKYVRMKLHSGKFQLVYLYRFKKINNIF